MTDETAGAATSRPRGGAVQKGKIMEMFGRVGFSARRIYAGADFGLMVGGYLVTVYACDLMGRNGDFPGVTIPQVWAVMDDFGYLVPVSYW